MLPIYWAISLGLWSSSGELHTITRWLIWSKDYKAQVLAQPNAGSGTLKHIEWDAWGFPGAGNTTVYLVFDPDNSLSTAPKTNSEGKFRGIPCGVSQVRKLESRYYTIILYTDTDWSHCNSGRDLVVGAYSIKTRILDNHLKLAIHNFRLVVRGHACPLPS
jgi:hypothetical protein